MQEVKLKCEVIETNLINNTNGYKTQVSWGNMMTLLGKLNIQLVDNIYTGLFFT